MRFLINMVLAGALLAPIPLLGQQAAVNAPACRAERDGDRLTTAIEFVDGYTVAAPWQVLGAETARGENGQSTVSMDLFLDRVVETDPATGEQTATPFPEPVRTSFEGRTEEELIYHAAQVWCMTVLEAQETMDLPVPVEPRDEAHPEPVNAVAAL